jgi:branched-chain amino acid transport system substrate-binding protein
VGAKNIEGAFDIDFTQYRVNPKVAPGINDFVKKYQAKYGTPPRSGHSLANYFGAKAIFAALNKAHSMDKDAIRAELMKLDIPLGTTATGWGVKFGPDGQNIRCTPFLLQWQDGELVTVYPAEAAVAKLKTGVGSM